MHEMNDIENYLRTLYFQAKGTNDDLTGLVKNLEFRDVKSICFDSYCILNIYKMESHFRDIIDVIPVNFASENVGFLCITNKDIAVKNCLTELNRYEIIYVWNFYRKYRNLPIKFDNDFLIIKEEFFIKYILDYLDTAKLWGGFTHYKQNNIQLDSILEVNIPLEKIDYPTLKNLDNAILALNAGNLFENYLKIYHQLELIFNLIFIRKLQKLNINDFERINSIYKNINKDEIELINYIIENYVLKLEIFLKLFILGESEYEDVCQNLLRKYGKESNPLKDEDRFKKFNEFLFLSKQNNAETFSDFFAASYSAQFCKKENEFKKSINRILGYWIYRIRCSIAHNKFGEFIFENDAKNLNFMLKIGLPLIRELVVEVFSNDEFKQLFK